MFFNKKNNKNIKLKYFKCMRGGEHDGQALNYVCLDKKCKKVGLLCSICKQDHSNHSIVPLKLLLTQLKTHNEQPMQSSEAFQTQLEELENQYALLMNQLQVIVEKIAEDFRTLEVHIHQQFSNAKIELLQRVQLNMRFNNFIDQALKNKIDSRQDFQCDIRRIAVLTKLEGENISFQNQLISVINKYKAFKNITIQKFNNISNIIDKENLIVETKELSDQQINKMQQITNSKLGKIVPFQYGFATDFKSSTIVISKHNLEAKQTKSGEGRFVFVNKGLGVINQSIVFKITNLKNWIGVGIANQQQMKALGFKFQYNQPYHGSYLISSNGYSWSHSQPGDNVKTKSFKFKQDDILQLRYLYQSLEFKNRTTKQSFSLKIAWKQKEQENACFCANLCSQGDTIEILNE